MTKHPSRHLDFAATAALLISISLIFGACTDGEESAPTTRTQPDETVPPQPDETVPPQPDETVPPMEQEGKLTVAVTNFPFEALVPWLGSTANLTYIDPMVDYMFYYDIEAAQVLPGLVEDWSVSDDGLSWTFEIRQGVAFHNGREMTADDIAYTIEAMIMNEESIHSSADRLRPVVDSVEQVGEYELVVNLLEPEILLPTWLGSRSAIPVLPREYEEMETSAIEDNPIGTGSYRFVSRSPGDSIHYEAVEQHWRTVPSYRELELRVVSEPSTRLAMITAGEVDIADLPLSMKSQAEEAGVTLIRAEQAISVLMIFTGLWDPEAPAFDPELPWLDRRVREALNLAVDKEAIIERIFLGEGESGAQWGLLPWLVGYKDEWRAPPYDPDRARELLAEAGYADGFPITLMSFPRPGVPDLPVMVEAVAGYWQAIGLETTIRVTDWGALRPVVRGREETPFAFGEATGVTSEDFWPIWYLEPFHTFEISPELNAALIRIGESDSEASLIESIGEAGDLILEEFANVPIAYLNALYAVNPDTVADWNVGPRGLDNLSSVTRP